MTDFNMEAVDVPKNPLKRVLPEHHVLIIGPGKCGSTLMVKILGLLGLETGYKKEALQTKDYLNSGGTRLEWPCRDEKADFYLKKRGNMPYVIKSNLLSLDLPEAIKKWDWEVDYVYFLTRTTEDIVKRHFIDRVDIKDKKKRREETVIRRKAALIDNLAKLDLPFILLNYPRFAEDVKYCFNKLEYLIDKLNISYREFKITHNSIVDRNKLRGW